MKSTKARILDVAESAARRGGYHSFSFRDIADEIGIKSASIHYHFPTKGDLARALAERYRKEFFKALPAPRSVDRKTSLNELVNALRASSQQDGMMCLCGMMAAEVDALPPEAAKEARAFFKQGIDWLEQVLSDAEPNADKRLAKALAILAGLEGALITRRGLGVPSGFDIAAREIVETLTGEIITLR